MRTALLIDFGSTYTKLTAVDLDKPKVLGSAQAFTTAATDLSLGLKEAMASLEIALGVTDFDMKLACSSAAGGLNMVACGLVPGLTSKAAKLAAFGAGAKVIKTFAYTLTAEDVKEIERIKPDILLLCGGIDGGNSEVITANAHTLAKTHGDFPVVIAGNRNAQDACAAAFIGSSHAVHTAPNVMPEMNRLNIEPVAEVIRSIFLDRIILAKGLNKANAMLDGILMPTPSAVLEALTLLSRGTKKTKGLGDLIAVDLGGATTDIYSIAKGYPVNPTTVLRGLPEPMVKRTVEGDLGMRYNAEGILDAFGIEALASLCGLPVDTMLAIVRAFCENPALLPANEQEKQVDKALAAAAVSIALSRHAGTLEQVYTPVGPVYQQTGKDLTQIKRLLVTGGALVYAKAPDEIIKQALSLPDMMCLVPRETQVTVDKRYILSAMGLLAQRESETAMKIMLDIFGREEEDAAVK